MHVRASQKLVVLFFGGGGFHKKEDGGNLNIPKPLNPKASTQILGIFELDMETSVTGNFGDLSELSFSNSCLPGEKAR